MKCGAKRNFLYTVLCSFKKVKDMMTFSEYIIKERSEFFYLESLKDIIKSNSKKTLEEWFSDMYYDYKLLHTNNCTPENCRHGY